MSSSSFRWRSLWTAFLILAVLVSAAVAGRFYFSAGGEEVPPSAIAPTVAGDVSAGIHDFCAACHAFPPPDSFPRSSWKKEVEQGYMFFAQSTLSLQAPPIDGVVKYYEDRAPRELPLAAIERFDGPPPVRLARTKIPVLPEAADPAISNVNLVHLFDERRLDVLACDMRHGLVMALRPYAQSKRGRESFGHVATEPLKGSNQTTPDPFLIPAGWQVLGHVANPAHAEVVDLDGDGIKDILVANLGNFSPTDRRTGSVVWLRGRPDGSFTPIPLLEGVGRVADVQAADFRGLGKLDLVVAVFGWRETGEVLYLENRTVDWSHPVFEPRVLDSRHGAIHVPVGDVDGDGRPDIVALISQEHETVVAFLNDGKGGFRKETIYTAPHPAYGSSGIQLVDLNGDGRLDVLYTNGDTLDQPYLLKPYHGIQWLENQGRFRFVHHPIATMYGVHRAVAADFQGTGRKDVVAVSFLPVEGFPHRQALDLDAVIYLEQKSPGQFVRHSLERVTCDHVTCAAGDIYGTGRIDIVAATYRTGKADHVLTIWKNGGNESDRVTR